MLISYVFYTLGIARSFVNSGSQAFTLPSSISTRILPTMFTHSWFLKLIIVTACLLPSTGWCQNYAPSRENPPMVTREFRGAWVASVYNIDWPSRKGLSSSAQQGEMRAMLDQMARLKLNAMIFQVRPHGDALYKSSIEPWSPWLTGTMGRSPGYDPLAYCISQAHARGIEVHAWFNPFRALPNATMSTSSDHVCRTHPSLICKFKTYKWMDPANSFSRQRALSVILDVTRRYDVDGIHIDDYFYPYPDVDSNGKAKQQFPDGKSPSQRRGYVDNFVQQMYTSVKQSKPWARVGISPFGIWRPGVPSATTASIDAYEHLAADSRKWLQKGWCDYLSPQLYWRIEGPQGYTKLLSWWRDQGKRPVWPGIATARIKSSEDPGRPASEIINQVNLSRTTGQQLRRPRALEHEVTAPEPGRNFLHAGEKNLHHCGTRSAHAMDQQDPATKPHAEGLRHGQGSACQMVVRQRSFKICYPGPLRQSLVHRESIARLHHKPDPRRRTQRHRGERGGPLRHHQQSQCGRALGLPVALPRKIHKHPSPLEKKTCSDNVFI